MDTVDILAKEYFQIMGVIQNFDDLSMIIKGWSITVGVALIGFSLKYNKKVILLVCCFCSLCFLFVDAKYKQYQVSYYSRMSEIEGCIEVRENTLKNGFYAYSKCKPLRVDQSWDEAKSANTFIQQLKKSNVYLPHFVIFVMALALFIIWKPVTNINE